MKIPLFSFFSQILGCGQRAFDRVGSIKKTARIGNSTARIEEFPWMVSITKDGNNFCSGTLISTKHILTASHCFDRYHPDDFTVVLGSDNLKNQDYYRIERFIERVFVHPGYKVCCHYFDIAIAELDIEVPYDANNPGVTPICLPTEASEDPDHQVGQLVTLAGYGRTPGEKDNPRLRFATMQIHSQSWCNHKYQDFGSLPRQFQSDIICAGYVVSVI